MIQVNDKPMTFTTVTLYCVYATGKRVKCSSYIFNASLRAVEKRHDMIVQGLVNRAHQNGFDALLTGDMEVTANEYNMGTYTREVSIWQ